MGDCKITVGRHHQDRERLGKIYKEMWLNIYKRTGGKESYNDIEIQSMKRHIDNNLSSLVDM